MRNLSAFFVCVFICFPAFAEQDTELAQLDSYTYRIRSRFENVPTENGLRTVTNWGSGVAVDLSKYGLKEHKYLLTAAHVVRSKTEPHYPANIVINPEKEIWFTCSIFIIDIERDICILKTIEKLPHVAALSDIDMKIDLKTITVGHPRGQIDAVFSKGNVKEIYVQDKFIVVAPGFFHGNSGGPIFFNDKVCGILIAGFKKDEPHADGDDLVPDIAICVSIQTIKIVLENSKK